jgi:anti-sigma regulatory factor (Ser/Thr protein kinase)
MATVELRFSALPAHVRTARLVAASVARRSGVDEALLDEVRLAVGEACSRAVGRHRRTGIDDPVRVFLRDDPGRFWVDVCDAGAEADLADAGLADTGLTGAGFDTGFEDTGLADAGLGTGLDDVLSLAVLAGLVEDLEVRSDGQEVVVRMSWPAMGR